MLVGPIFDDDNDIDFMWLQHGCYYEAINEIVKSCFKYYAAACKMVGIERTGSGADCKSFDHRIFQPHHDIMAGYWRYKFARIQPYLPGMNPANINDWKNWCSEEVKRWSLDDTKIIYFVVNAVLYKFTDVGYKAKDDALNALKQRYHVMSGGYFLKVSV